MNKHDFCDAVERIVREQYGYDDGGDLAFILLESCELSLQDSTDHAARVVAQRMEQA